MKSRYFPGLTSGREDGAVVIFVVCAISFMFIALTALAIDSGHMVMVKNELQNAADAGALAGAALLFDPTDGSINAVVSDEEAETVARANPHAGTNGTDSLDVVAHRGHWSFSTLTFTESNNTEQLTGWEGMTAEDLDGELAFINAVKVTTTRENTATFFAGFFGMFDTKISTDAVAYIGFASTIADGEVDVPFALCLEHLTLGSGEIACGVARAVGEGVETGGWTNFSQDGQETFDECTSSNTSYVNGTVLGNITYGDCSGVNPDPLKGGEAIGAINGNVQTTYDKIVENCFVGVHPDNYIPDVTYYQNSVKYHATEPWRDVTFPVVICGDGNYAGGVCDADKVKFAGIINVDIIWMSAGKNNVPKKYIGLPKFGQPNAFDCEAAASALLPPETANDITCWREFQKHYDWNFADPDNDGLPENNGMYLSPNCDYVPNAGSTGSFNMGIMAAIPVLVE